MCGITFTTCSGKINSSKVVYSKDILKLIIKITQSKNNKKNIKQLLNLVWVFKNDISFLNYYKSRQERETIKICILKLKKFLLSLEGKEAENIKDIKWIIDEELKIRLNFIKLFCKNKEITDSAIIFFKTLNSVVNSINLLETRGRDSLGLQLSIQIDNNKENIKFLKNQKIKNNIFIKIKKEKIFINKVYKIYNIFGSLGDNIKIILETIKKDKFILDIIFQGLFRNINIIAHTRWASVGGVNLDNTHPVINIKKVHTKVPTIFSIMNGDIQNYQEIISSINKIKKVAYNNFNRSDTLALSLLFSKKNLVKNIDEIKKEILKIKGSFASVSISDDDISKLVLIRKGNAGIYCGKNEDRKFFSSDVYGLVEETRNIFEIQKDTFSVINMFSNNSKLKLNNIFLKSKTEIKNELFKNVNLSTRDVSKKNFPYYLQKEIYETKDIVNKTINTYLHSDNTNKKKNLFIENAFKKMKPLMINFKKNKIDHIIITGMGTCFTAANHIASYMKKKLSDCLPYTRIESQLASESSAFSLKKEMKKTLIIAIAQSGTTKDTNVFLELAKKRGAKTISLLNKRNGDISYITDLVFYIGDGRDIEIAVPSTKTFTAHILLGYIFTLYIKDKIDRNKIIDKDLNEIYKVPKIISKTLKSFKKSDSPNLYSTVINYKNWFVSYDDESKKYSSEEIRIKLSECCYRSLLNINIEEIVKYQIHNSVIIYNVGYDLKKFKDKINLLINKNNFVILIGLKKNLRNIKNDKKIFKLYNPNVRKNFYPIPSVINGQLLSFNIAKTIDKQSNIFKTLTRLIEKNANQKIIDKFNVHIKNAKFKCNFPLNRINQLIKDTKNFNNNNKLKKYKVLQNLKFLEKFSQRPIDTIKHQAKTITVGTERIENYNKSFNNPSEIINKYKFKNIYQDDLVINNSKNVENIIIINNSKHKFFSEFMYNYLRKYFTSAGLRKNIYLSNLQNNQNLNNAIYLETSQSKNYKKFFSLNFKIKLNSEVYNIDGTDLKNNYLIDQNNEIMKNFKNMVNVCHIIINNVSEKNKTNFENYKSNIINQLENAVDAVSSKKIQSKILLLKKKLKDSLNLKILGGGFNLPAAEFLSHLISSSQNRSCGYDTLESHKHIDMSAEPLIITLMGNMFDYEYLKDCNSELDKCISHDNEPFLVITKNYSKHFQKIENSNLVEIPYVQKELISILYFKLFEKLYN